MNGGNFVRRLCGGCALLVWIALVASLAQCDSGSVAEAIDMAAGLPDLSGQPDLSQPPDLMPPLPMLRLVAGGLGGRGNVDGVGTASRFRTPMGVTVDGTGTLYVVDNQDNTLRQMVLATGVVTAVAGLPGQIGSVDGSGTAARFRAPGAVAADGAGNVYIADSSNHTIRKVVIATGAVTTLAGMAGVPAGTDGTGAAARFNTPQGLVYDGVGNLYVADSTNGTIRQVVVATGAVTTLAGTAGTIGSTDGTGATARFKQPVGVAFDGAGTLYVCDSFNQTIRKIVIATGVVTTVAGTAGMSGLTDGTGSVARFNIPGGLALDRSGNLYIADTNNHSIRNLVLSTGAVTTVAGASLGQGSVDGIGGAARFSYPQGVALDGSGNLYVADSGNGTIRKVAALTAAVTTVGGAASASGNVDGTGAAARFGSLRSLAMDGSGNLYVADAGNQTIRQIVTATGAVTTLVGMSGMAGSADGTGAAARFNAPWGLAADTTGNLYVADGGNQVIRKVVISTGVVTTLAGTAGMAGSTDGTGAAARFTSPRGISLDGVGNLYVVDAGTHIIRKVVLATGVVTTLAGLAGVTGSTDGVGAAALFNNPRDVAADGAGNLYVADLSNRVIRQVVISTGVVTTPIGTVGMAGSTDGIGAAARFGAIQGLTADRAGNLYVSDSAAGTVRRVVLATATVTTLVGVAGQIGVKPGPLPAGLNGPIGLAVSASGELFVSDANENSILGVR